MGNFEIRKCSIGDQIALSLIGQATFLETFAGVLNGQDILAHCRAAHSDEIYSDWLRDGQYSVWLVEISPGSASIGFMVVANAQLPIPDLSPEDLEIKRIYLLNKFQGRGVGRSLVMQALRHGREVNARRLMLGVYAKNESAIGFYDRFGFRKIGTRTFTVGSQNYDDFIMSMPIA